MMIEDDRPGLFPKVDVDPDQVTPSLLPDPPSTMVTTSPARVMLERTRMIGSHEVTDRIEVEGGPASDIPALIHLANMIFTDGGYDDEGL